MDVIRPIEPTTSNGHMIILVAIDYFIKWVEAISYKVVAKNVIADFIRDRIVCRFGVPESIITDNTANLNSDLMKAMSEPSTSARVSIPQPSPSAPTPVRTPALRTVPMPTGPLSVLRVKKMRKTQTRKKSVDALRAEVTRIAKAGDLPFDMIQDPAQPHPYPSSHKDLATHTEELRLVSSTIEAVCDMFSYHACPAHDDGIIQLAKSAGTDDAGDTLMMEDT
nr:uncharacterized protein LOC108947664 [Nicotiana tomentosiformis]